MTGDVEGVIPGKTKRDSRRMDRQGAWWIG